MGLGETEESRANTCMLGSSYDFDKNMQVLVLAASVTTGRTIAQAAEAVSYYGGTVGGVAAIFSNVEQTPEEMEIFSIFHKEDLPDYQAYQPSECPMCRRKQPLDAIVNSFGYSKL